jgi:hypothetical protein
VSNAALSSFRAYWDTADPFGSAMSCEGAIADTLYRRDSSAIPSEWDYSPGMSGPDLDEYFEYLSVFDTPTLLFAGNVLHRIIHLCILEGRDY